MTMPASLTIALQSPTSPGSTPCIGADVDWEIERNEVGLPIISGPVLRGLLLNVWRDVAPAAGALSSSASRLFATGAAPADQPILAIGDAQLPAPVTAWLTYLINREASPSPRHSVLGALTTVETRWAVHRGTGAGSQRPAERTRALVAGVELVAPLTWLATPSEQEVALLALCVLGVRRLGRGRSRGRGRVRCHLGSWESTVSLAASLGDGDVR